MTIHNNNNNNNNNNMEKGRMRVFENALAKKLYGLKEGRGNRGMEKTT